jgi:hypothetical protein
VAGVIGLMSCLAGKSAGRGWSAIFRLAKKFFNFFSKHPKVPERAAVTV